MLQAFRYEADLHNGIRGAAPEAKLIGSKDNMNATNTAEDAIPYKPHTTRLDGTA